MEKYKVEKTFIHSKCLCAVIMTTLGHRCGYVGVTMDNMMYGIHYSDPIPGMHDKDQDLTLGKKSVMVLLHYDKGNISPDLYFDVHGGLTFSKKGNLYPIYSQGWWWFGYDCSHCDDGQDLSYMEPKLRKIYETFPQTGTIRSLTYCIEECKNLADQLNKFYPPYKQNNPLTGGQNERMPCQ